MMLFKHHLEGCRCIQEVFTKVAAALVERPDYHKTVQQCREKVKKLKLEYWRVRDKMRKSGEGRYPEWNYFDAIDAILATSQLHSLLLYVVNSQSTSDEQEHKFKEELSATPESPRAGSEKDQPEYTRRY